MNKFDLYNLTALATAAEVEPRTLQAAVEKYRQTGEATPALVQANQFLADFDGELLYEELATDQAQSYLRDLRNLGWTTGRILKVALVEFWHNKDIVRCSKCESAQVYPPEIPVFEEEYEHECSKCHTKFIVQL